MKVLCLHKGRRLPHFEIYVEVLWMTQICLMEYVSIWIISVELRFWNAIIFFPLFYLFLYLFSSEVMLVKQHTRCTWNGHHQDSNVLQSNKTIEIRVTLGYIGHHQEKRQRNLDDSLFEAECICFLGTKAFMQQYGMFKSILNFLVNQLDCTL